MAPEDLSPEFWKLVVTQDQWNPYIFYAKWVPFLVPFALVPVLYWFRRAAGIMSVFFIAIAGMLAGYLLGTAGDYSLRTLTDAAKTEADTGWVYSHDTLIMLPIGGFVRGIWWSSIVTALLRGCDCLLRYIRRRSNKLIFTQPIEN